MADNLFLRKGTLADLATAAIVPGSINFTTDEPAIYLDVDASTRKRIGDIIIVSTVDELVSESNGLAPGAKVGTWSTTALYYIVENNALMRWDGTAWTQLNATEAGSIKALTDRVDGLEGTQNALSTLVSQQGTSITKNAGDIAANAEKITANESAIALKANQTDLDTLTQTVSQKANQSTVEGLSESVSGLTATITDPVNGLNSKASSTTVEGISQKVNTLETTVQTKANASDLQALQNSISGDNGLTSKVNANTEAISGINTALGNKADKTTVEALTEEVNKKADSTTVSGINTRLSAAETKVVALETTQERHETRITDIEEANSGLSTAIDNLNSTKADKTEVTSQIAAHNAMTFKGSVSAKNELPIANVSIGDTYVVSKDFTDASAFAGDLFVAVAKEGADESNGILAAEDIKWEYVNTGYIQGQQPKLLGDGNAIVLQSYAGESLGGVAVEVSEPTKSNLTATVAGNKLVIGMEWGTF